jgi:hypothetical protein
MNSQRASWTKLSAAVPPRAWSTQQAKEPESGLAISENIGETSSLTALALHVGRKAERWRNWHTRRICPEKLKVYPHEARV